MPMDPKMIAEWKVLAVRWRAVKAAVERLVEGEATCPCCVAAKVDPHEEDCPLTAFLAAPDRRT